MFLVDEEKLLVDRFVCPQHWVKVGGFDPGWDHPSGFAEIWHDRDLDIIYLARSIRMRHKTPLEHVEVVRSWRLKWAFPADGKSQTLAGAGLSLAQQYSDAGLDVMHEHETHEAGGMSVEAGIADLHDRMKGGRFKVFRGENDAFLEEYSRCTTERDGSAR